MTTDYAEMQREFAERVIHDPYCKECRFRPYTLNDPHDEGDGWEPAARRAGMIKPCAPCKQRRPYAWLKDVSPIAFTMRVQEIEKQVGGGAFLLSELDVLNDKKPIAP